MSTPYQRSLLRRTFAALAAVAALGAVDAQAQGKVKLNGANGTECSYSSMSITPDGTVTVQCSGTTTPPPPPPAGQTFSLTPLSPTIAPNTTTTLTIQRNNGTAGTYLIYWELTGCPVAQPQPAVVQFNEGVPAVAIAVAVGASGPCVVRLHPPSYISGTSGATLWDGNSTATITVSATAPPPPPPPTGIAGCPTGYVPPENMISRELIGIGNPVTQGAASGQVVSMKIPTIAGRLSGQVNILETTITAQPATLEFTVSKCPGLIETDLTNFCNYRTQNAAMSSITYFRSPPAAPYDNAAAVNSLGYCWAADGGDLYVNARWTMQQGCPWGGGSCGYAFQYGNGPW